MAIRLLIADGQQVVLHGVRALLADSDVLIVAAVAGGSEAVQQCADTSPDVALISTRLASDGVLETLERLKQVQPNLPVILLSEYDHPAQLGQAHALGACGLLRKNFDRQRLLEAIREAVQGGDLWSRTQIRRITATKGKSPSDADLEAPLTQREGDVLQAIAEGLTNIQISQRLGISSETVKEHVQHILRKVGVDDRTQAAIWAVRHDVV